MIPAALAMESSRHNPGCLLWLLSFCMLHGVLGTYRQQLRPALMWCLPWMYLVVLSEAAAQAC